MHKTTYWEKINVTLGLSNTVKRTFEVNASLFFSFNHAHCQWWLSVWYFWKELQNKLYPIFRMGVTSWHSLHMCASFSIMPSSSSQRNNITRILILPNIRSAVTARSLSKDMKLSDDSYILAYTLRQTFEVKMLSYHA